MPLTSSRPGSIRKHRRLTGSRTGWLAATALVALAGCRAPEPPEAAQARAIKRVLEDQLFQLAGIVGAARRGDLLTDGHIAIGLSESFIERLLTASLPSEHVLAGRLRLKLDEVKPYFRGGVATIAFRAVVSSTDVENARVRLEMAGGLKDVKLEKGRLLARVSLVHFTVLDSFAGALGKNLVEDAVRANLDTIEDSIPPLEVPVALEEGVEFRGLEDGPVQVGAGRLPLEFGLSRVVPVNERLWLLVHAAAGKWDPRPATIPATTPAAGP